MEMFTDPRIDAIQCLRGGYGSAQIIPHLDFEMIAKNPKLFVGFSDITALHCALWRAIKLVTLYGPSLTANPSEFTEHWLLKAVRGETAEQYPADPDGPSPQCLTEGSASGILVGGCLSDLVHTLGTPWEIDLDGAIFAFEEVGSGPHGIDRILLHLQQARKLERVRGIVVGDLTQPDVDEGGRAWVYSKTVEEMLRDRLAPLGVPVLYRLPFGHTKDFAGLPLGVRATLDGSRSRLTIEEPVARAT
jgi:muramoyltetrapeptide carboxypeptidase